MKFFGKLLFLLLFISACSTKDEGILCETGPVGFSFEIVDAATGKNLFTSGSYTPDQLQIENQKGETVTYRFLKERDVIDVLLGWESKSDVYTVTLNEDITFDLVFSLRTSSSGGCTSTSLAELEIEGVSYEINDTNGLATIYVN